MKEIKFTNEKQLKKDLKDLEYPFFVDAELRCEANLHEYDVNEIHETASKDGVVENFSDFIVFLKDLIENTLRINVFSRHDNYYPEEKLKYETYKPYFSGEVLIFEKAKPDYDDDPIIELTFDGNFDINMWVNKNF